MINLSVVNGVGALNSFLRTEEVYALMNLLSLFILQAIAACSTYDLQLEGVVRIGDGIMKVLQGDDIRRLDHSSKKGHENKAYQRTGNFVTTRMTELMEYINHIKWKGKETLQNIGKYIKEGMRINKDIKGLINKAIADFIVKIQDYSNVVTSDKSEYKIDEDFVFLDMVETSNRLLYGDAKILLSNIVIEVNDTKNIVNFQQLNKKLYKESITNKKEEMDYICNSYKLCREYPSFTDYTADFISEVLKMPDKNLERVINVFKNLIISNSNFFDKLLKNEDKVLIIHECEEFLNEMSKMREFLLVLRAVMKQRFKIVHNSNTELKTRTKAIRILLDIIDKALTTKGEDIILTIDFSNTIHAVKLWDKGVRDDIEKILGRFVDNIIQKLNYVFNENTREEIMTLIEVIIRGRTENESVYNNLYKIGSEFVRGDENHIWESDRR